MTQYSLFVLVYHNNKKAVIDGIRDCGQPLDDFRFVEPQLKSINSVIIIDVKLDNLQEYKASLLSVSQKLAFDYCLKESNTALSFPKLVVFDMDSTLIPIEVIDQLAEQAGVKAQVSQITELAMRGELDFNQSFKKRMEWLKGLSIEAVDKVKSQLEFNPGVRELCHYLLSKDCEVAIASGGFVPFAEHLRQSIPFSEVKANDLLVEEGVLTGEVVEPIVNAQIKAESLYLWQTKRGLQRHQLIAVGDGANDVMMMDKAGLGVAYKAKPKVCLLADCVITIGEMDSLIELLEVITTDSD